MPLHDKLKSAIAKRRLRVSQLFAMGITSPLEICEGLTKGNDPLVNPETRRPYSLRCVCYDLAHLRKEMKEQTTRNILEAKAEQLGKILGLYRRACQLGRLDTALRCLEREARLLGLDEPIRMDVNERDIDATIERELAQLAIARQAKAIEPPTPEIGVAG